MEMEMPMPMPMPSSLSMISSGNVTSEISAVCSLQHVFRFVGMADMDPKRASDALVVLSAVVFVFLAVLQKYLNSGTTGEYSKPAYPPSPPRWPILGNLPSVVMNGGELHTALRLLGKKMGPIYTLWLGRSFPLVVVTGEEATQEALITQGTVFAARPMLISWQYISSGYKTTMTSPMGPHWQKLRKIISHDLLSPAKLASYKPVRDTEIERLINRFKCLAAENNGVVNPLLELRESAVDIIMRIGFGDDFAKLEGNNQNAKVKELDQNFRDIMDAGSIFQIALDSSSVIRTLLFPASRKCYNNIRTISANITDLVMPIILERKKQLKERPVSDANTFVDALINLKGEDKLTDMEIVWNVAELMVGGTDNTSHILEWILAEMVTHPEIQAKAYGEVRVAMGPNLERRLVQESELPKLPFVQAIVKESMRLHMMAVLAIPKIATQETKLRGYDIPKGTMVIFHAGALALDEDIWADPMEFRPERFINADRTPREMKCAYMPFGAGRRSCPGSSMGMLHLHLLLANLLYAFEWGPEAPGKPVDFTEKFRMVVTMKTRLRATITPRSHI
ncbi:hypothetical protein KC19_10G041300 [Ceratodon purpureus]|uniref:Cytochrome P450 n=1 Tax=Ceratodon purpureus TaxID=3225 RepID=A0A8T0GKA6_CERPU|nr:hypothetical protein KC19_10G041300 [Ceratodon purpureus]